MRLMNDKTKNIIENFRIAYGFLPCLKAIEILEQKEEYELCGCVLNVLHNHFKRFDMDFPARYSKDAVKQMKDAMLENFGLSGDVSESNNDYYAGILLEQLIEI